MKKFLPFGTRLRSTPCWEFNYLKLCRPAYFVRTTQLLPHPGHEQWKPLLSPQADDVLPDVTDMEEAIAEALDEHAGMCIFQFEGGNMGGGGEGIQQLKRSG